MAGHVDAWRQAHGDEYGSDEGMIAERLWPMIGGETLMHSDFGDRYGLGGVVRPFPTKEAEGFRLVGERMYEDNQHRLVNEPARVATREDLLRLIPPNAVVAEVGVFRGEFANRILEICRPAELHLIDLWTGSATSGDKDGRNIVTVEDMEAVYGGLCDRYRDMSHVHLHRGDSVVILSRFPDRSLDAAYLDTSHHYEATLAELDVLARKIKPGGLLMGHDYYPGCPVWPAVNAWCARNRQRIAWLTSEDGCPSFGIVLEEA